MNKDLEKYLFNGQRFTQVKEYKFDKLVFSTYMLLMLIIFMIIFILNGMDRSMHTYYHCPEESLTPCKNPFYQKYPVCENFWMTACNDYQVEKGFTYGELPPWIVVNWWFIMVLGLFAGIIINHFWHNRGKQLDFGE